MARSLAEAFREYAARKLEDHLGQINRCGHLLDERQLWYRPNARSNSAANLVLHLAGNVRQWIIGGIGGQPMERDRQAEFDRQGGIGREAMLGPLAETVGAACGVIRACDEAALTATYDIQSYRVSGAAAIAHVVEHFAFHTGQIVTTTKWLLDVDLSIYDERGQRRDGRRDETP
jgi:uncharacterized damage-inducible protein DinB